MRPPTKKGSLSINQMTCCLLLYSTTNSQRLQHWPPSLRPPASHKIEMPISFPLRLEIALLLWLDLRVSQSSNSILNSRKTGENIGSEKVAKGYAVEPQEAYLWRTIPIMLLDVISGTVIDLSLDNNSECENQMRCSQEVG